jgi:hypothetical protein
MATIESLRRKYHQTICRQVIHIKADNKPSMADVSSHLSVEIARGLLKRMKYPVSSESIDGQTAGQRLEQITKDFLEKAFKLLQHLRPGHWQFSVHGNISDFDQYRHLAVLSELADTHKELKITLGEYVIQPDIIIARRPISDDEINRDQTVIDPSDLPHYTPLRASNTPAPILHASISCKWTIRSDRSQNARTEGLNLIRNRKGHTPHIAVITGEPMPSRIASLAMGTGDIDCVYHFALPELIEAVKDTQQEAAIETLDILIDGRRLRDIADLPFDLAV